MTVAGALAKPRRSFGHFGGALWANFGRRADRAPVFGRKLFHLLAVSQTIGRPRRTDLALSLGPDRR